MVKNVILPIAICSAFIFSSFCLDAEASGHIHFGDVRLDSKSLKANKASTGFLAYSSLPWHNGIVPVKFGKNISRAHQAEFWLACQIWSAEAQVTCRPKKSYDKNYLSVTDTTADRCWTDLGAGENGGIREFNFAMDWCWAQSALIHEVGHVLGLMHEHQRPDRDLYLDVHSENAGAFAFAYEKLSIGPLDNTGPYDFLSIMHYWDAAYSINGKPVLIPKKPFENFAKLMGRTNQLSTGDKILIRKIYGAN